MARTSAYYADVGAWASYSMASTRSASSAASSSKEAASRNTSSPASTSTGKGRSQRDRERQSQSGVQSLAQLTVAAMRHTKQHQRSRARPAMPQQQQHLRNQAFDSSCFPQHHACSGYSPSTSAGWVDATPLSAQSLQMQMQLMQAEAERLCNIAKAGV